MKNFRDISINEKLMLVILLISGVTVLLVCAVFSGYEFLMFRHATIRALSAHAEIIAANSTATFEFERQDEAAGLLTALQAEPHIVIAALFDKTGQPFAHYIRPNVAASLPDAPGPDGDHFGRHRLTVVRPVMLNGKRIGTVFLESDLQEMYSRLRLYAMMAILVVGASLLFTLFLSTRVQRIISRPILALAGAANRVSEHKDYSVRVPKFSNDELGQLTGAFNEMLAKIERATDDLRFDETRLEALLQLNQMTGAPQRQLVDFAIDEGVRLTKSELGYIGFMNPGETVLQLQSWTRAALDRDDIPAAELLYPVETIGRWGEAIRQRKPIITNSYTELNPLKQSHPLGRVAIQRHMNIPVFDNDLIVAVAGVLNKAEPYNESDVRQLTLLMQGMWRLIQRKRADEALQRAHDELEQRVEQRTAELAKTNQALQAEIAERQHAEESVRLKAEQLARSNAELEQFAYVASHDLQEPLRMVTSYLQLLEARYKTKLDKDASDFIGFAVDGAMRMRNLIKDLLEYSRVGRKGHTFAPTDLKHVIHTALTNLKTAVDEHKARILPGPLPIVSGDETQLTQLLQNLIGNAIKFHGAEPPEVRIEAVRRNHEWVFAIRDNGIGIDPQYADRIFIIFQRLHSRDKYPGTGIGLAICKKIVERHGGRIWVNSQPGKGASFYFTLPAHAPDVTP